MADITCPVCGEVNSAEQEFCQYCQSRLQPLTGPLKDADAPILPGQFPTKKQTAELEPILPQWLREARDKARKTAEETASQAEKESQSKPSDSAPDLLAGLRSQGGEDEEETPDWLANITGVPPKPKKIEPEPTEVHWVELGRESDFTQKGEASGITATEAPSETASEGDLPPWLAGVQPSQDSETDELTDWLRQEDSRKQPQEHKPTPLKESGSVLTDADSKSNEPLPDWLKKLQTDQSAQADVSPAQSPLLNTGPDADWLKGLQSEQLGVGQESAKDEAPISTELPAWLKDDAAKTTEEPSSTEVPTWLRSASSTPSKTAESAKPVEPALGDIPDWLKAAAPQASVFEEAPAVQSPAETPDWLSSLRSAGNENAPAFTTETPNEDSQSPAFTEESMSSEDVDALFTEMPDWLSKTGSAEQTSGGTPSATVPASGSALTPGELPSWVQAMRPVESSVTQTSATLTSDQTLETQGALAGLHGVLPSVPNVGPSSKPKAYSIKLQASEEQLAHATLLEQILAAETAPEPIAWFSPLVAQRSLRWFLAILLLVFVSGALLLRTQIFALPEVGVPDKPNEAFDALTIAKAIPAGAPVLVVVDYEPALAGEMEATAGPLLNDVIILQHPFLTFISTSPTGGSLAERLFYAPPEGDSFATRLISGPLSQRDYTRGTQYLNLGYLPGGLAGVRYFAQYPSIAAPFDTDLKPAWDTTPLQNIKSLSQFATIIVITDNAETARTWIEQTTPARGVTPIIMVASAQAAPMIEPYYDSHQVGGMVSGLYGSAIFGQSNAGLPSLARTYWDSFSIGMLLAMVLILGGGLWNLVLGMHDRAAAGK